MAARPVVVGIDDLEHSAGAVAAAAGEARLRHAHVWLAHVYSWLPADLTGLTPGGDTPRGAVRDAATALLTQAVARVHTADPELDISTYAMSGRPGPCLAELAEDAALLVVGSRGRGGFAGMLLGSVSLSAVGHTRCPVLVVRGGAAPAPVAGRVLVGVDVFDPATGAEVLGFAFEEAALRGCGVCALHVWEDPGYFYPVALGGFPRPLLTEQHNERRKRLDSLVAPWREKHPDTHVETQVLTGTPSRLLVDSSRLADLLVLGGRRRDGHGVRLGSRADAALHHAHCPVVIVPE